VAARDVSGDVLQTVRRTRRLLRPEVRSVVQAVLGGDQGFDFVRGSKPVSDNADQREVVLSRQDVLAVLDRDARRYLSISGDEFIAHAHAGTLPDHPIVAHLAMLAGAP
jgi:hypothetical protein